MQRPNRWIRRAFSGFGLAILLQSPMVQAKDYDNAPQVREFIAEMANKYGFAEEQLNSLFSDVQRKQAILDAISRPAERVRPWKEYRPIFLTEARIAQGVDFWRQHEEALARAEAEYGVPAQMIVAIIGVETFYGRNTGSYRVMDALSTLCFDYPPRAQFFCQQLREYLMLVREQQVDALSLKGSYAGAMGLPQFMPGSFRAYAVDFDGDGHINIWSDPTDAIGSVASYFKAHGWQPSAPVVTRARVTGSRADEGLSPGLDASTTMTELNKLGWSSSEPVDASTPLTSFRLEGADGPEYWLGQPNFYTITRYNRSAMYAMAVYQLSQKLLEARGKH
jgi:membrane-bound lytic murein transglycosylase B